MARAGPAVPGHRPAPRTAAGVGAEPPTPTAWPRSATSASRRSPGFAVVKPQVAFFEAYGSAGYAVLERTIADLRDAGVLVLADAKRGDIGTTMAAYAAAWAGDSPLAADAVTASPYLGFGSLQPLLDTARDHDRGVFVLAATSNPEGASVQRAVADGRTVAQSIVDAPPRPTARTGSRLVGRGGRRDADRRRPTSALSTARCWCPASAPRAVAPRRWRASEGRLPGQLLPAVSREVLRAGRRRGAARRGRADARRGRPSGRSADARRIGPFATRPTRGDQGNSSTIAPPRHVPGGRTAGSFAGKHPAKPEYPPYAGCLASRAIGRSAPAPCPRGSLGCTAARYTLGF